VGGLAALAMPTVLVLSVAFTGGLLKYLSIVAMEKIYPSFKPSQVRWPLMKLLSCGALYFT
jgi:hypothetical protein